MHTSAARLRHLRSILQECVKRHPLVSQQSECHTHAASSCSPVTIKVTPKASLFDQDIQIKVEGLRNNSIVTLQAWIKNTWRRRNIIFISYGHFIASEEGTLDLEKDTSLDGTYTGVEPMGLLWSMIPLPGHPTDVRLVWKDVMKPCEIQIAAFSGHITPSDSSVGLEEPVITPLHVTSLSRWMKGADTQRIEIREGHVRGTMFLPPGQGPFRGVIDMFGSAGGIMESRAALLASHGFATLSLAFFRYEDLPQKMADIQLDYFEEAVEWFSCHTAVKNTGIGLIASSYGGTFAMLMALQCSQVKAAVLINTAPFALACDVRRKGQVVAKSYDIDFNLAIATKDGYICRDAILYKPEDVFPIWRSSTHFLCSLCEDDGLANPRWMEEVPAIYSENKRHQLELVHYPGAGHLLEPPYTPHCYASINSGGGFNCVWGGNVRQHSFAQSDFWKRTIRFLNDKL